MEDDIDIEEHDIFDNPQLQEIFPDIAKLKEEISEEERAENAETSVQFKNVKMETCGTTGPPTNAAISHPNAYKFIGNIPDLVIKKEKPTCTVCSKESEEEMCKNCVRERVDAGVPDISMGDNECVVVNEVIGSNGKPSDNAFSYDICEYGSITKSQLDRHCQIHIKQWQTCTLCDCKHKNEKSYYKCLFKSEINKHLRNDIGEKPYKCDLCNYRSSNNSNLKKHLMAKHTAEKPYKCDLCDYRCSKGTYLKNHLVAIHTGAKPYKCDLCDYRCSKVSHLKSHLMAKHTGGKPYKCDFCDYRCSRRGQLNDHSMAKHTGEKPYKCDLCDYRCSQRGQLKNHLIAKHTTEKPYRCNLCDYRSSQSSNVKNHLMAKHTGEKPYKCEFCDYRCSQRGQLKNHLMAKHTGEKPHKCNLCDYRCVQISSLKRHLVAKHRDEMP